jgi:hypothetical protein
MLCPVEYACGDSLMALRPPRADAHGPDVQPVGGGRRREDAELR